MPNRLQRQFTVSAPNQAWVTDITYIRTRDQARADIFDYIEMFYNRSRRHSHLGHVSPEAFEQASKCSGGVSV